MAKRYYQVGEPCDNCGTPTVLGKNGAYCKPCYIKWKNSQGNAPQAPRASNWNSTAQSGQRYQTAPTIDYEAKFNSQAQEINNLKMAVHSLWVNLIQGDPDKERNYELHKIPLVAKSKPVEPEPEPTKYEEPPF